MRQPRRNTIRSTGVGLHWAGQEPLTSRKSAGAAWQGLPGFQSQKLGSRPGAEVQDQIQLAVVAAEVFMAMREALWSTSGVPKWLHRSWILSFPQAVFTGGGQFLDVGEGGQWGLAAGDDGDICPGQLFQQRGTRPGMGAPRQKAWLIATLPCMPKASVPLE